MSAVVPKTDENSRKLDSEKNTRSKILRDSRVNGWYVNLDRNLKPKLAIMRQCTSVRQTDTDIVA